MTEGLKGSRVTCHCHTAIIFHIYVAKPYPATSKDSKIGAAPCLGGGEATDEEKMLQWRASCWTVLIPTVTTSTQSGRGQVLYDSDPRLPEEIAHKYW